MDSQDEKEYYVAFIDAIWRNAFPNNSTEKINTEVIQLLDTIYLDIKKTTKDVSHWDDDLSVSIFYQDGVRSIADLAKLTSKRDIKPWITRILDNNTQKMCVIKIKNSKAVDIQAALSR